MKKTSLRLKKCLLAVYFVCGGTCTFELTVERIRENQNLYAIMTVLAIVFDVLFFKTLFFLLKQKALPQAVNALGKLFSAVFKRIGTLVEKVSDVFSQNKDKTFVEGKNERTFVFEVRSDKAGQVRRKLPKLSKNANERERIRYEYTCYVFKRDRDISSSLTPNEVGAYLDETGEDKPIFDNYNTARYTKE